MDCPRFEPVGVFTLNLTLQLKFRHSVLVRVLFRYTRYILLTTSISLDSVLEPWPDWRIEREKIDSIEYLPGLMNRKVTEHTKHGLYGAGSFLSSTEPAQNELTREDVAKKNDSVCAGFASANLCSGNPGRSQNNLLLFLSMWQPGICSFWSLYPRIRGCLWTCGGSPKRSKKNGISEPWLRALTSEQLQSRDHTNGGNTGICWKGFNCTISVCWASVLRRRVCSWDKFKSDKTQAMRLSAKLSVSGIFCMGWNVGDFGVRSTASWLYKCHGDRLVFLPAFVRR